MKIRLEFIILGAVAIILSLYLVFGSRDRIRYKLPQLPKLSREDIKTITIEQHNRSITLTRSDGGWKILPEGFKADQDSVNRMLSTLTGLTLTDLVSVQKNYDRYDLGKDSLISVSVSNGTDTLRRLDIGKTAESSEHTFVKFENDDRVFFAMGNIHEPFTVDKEKLRDKLVLSFDQAEIQEMTLERGKETIRIIKATIPQNSEGQEQQSAKVVWKSEAGESWNAEKIDALLTTLSSLRCDSFIDGVTDLTRPVLSLSLKGTFEHRLTLFSKRDNDYPGLSSDSESTFLLSAYQVDKILDIWEARD